MKRIRTREQKDRRNAAERARMRSDPVYRARQNASKIAYRRRQPDGQRWFIIKSQYGLTQTAWETIFATQGYKCAICKSTDPLSKRGWHTDHDHNSGRVRGILCHNCNVAVPSRASIQWAHDLLSYLEKAQCG